MHDGDGTPIASTSYVTSNTALVTTLAALLVATGSAVLWRSSLLALAGVSSPSAVAAESAVAAGKKRDPGGGQDAATKPTRTKERRKRGKDPMKELHKVEKNLKGKLLATVNKPTRDANDSDSRTPTPAPLAPGFSNRSAEGSRDTSVATSSRSASSSASLRYRRPSIEFPPGPRPTSGESFSRHNRDPSVYADPASSSGNTPRQTRNLGTDDAESLIPLGATLPETSDAGSYLANAPPTVDDETIPSPSSRLRSSTSHRATSLNDSAPESAYLADVSLNSHTDVSTSTTSIATNVLESDDESHQPLPPADHVIGTNAAALLGMVTSLSMPHAPVPRLSSSYAPESMPASSTSTISSDSPVADEPLTTPTLFPSLNPPRVSSVDIPTSLTNGHANDMHGNSSRGSDTRAHPYSHALPPRRAHTPSSTVSSSSVASSRAHSIADAPGAPSPSLSTETQLASLRGALEAARQREDKMRADFEKMAKDLEMARYESVTGRQREAELQSQVVHLTHRLHSFGAPYPLQNNVSPHPGVQPPQPFPFSSPPLPHHLHIPPNLNGAYRFSLSASPSPTPSPTRPQNGSQLRSTPLGDHSIRNPSTMNGMLSPPPNFSPLGPQSPQHMLGYPIPPPGTHPQTFARSPLPGGHLPPSQLQPNPFAMFMPYAAAPAPGASSTAASGHSTASSSVGSMSPELAQGVSIAHPSSPPVSPGMATIYDARGRQRMRGSPAIPGASPVWTGDAADGWMEPLFVNGSGAKYPAYDHGDGEGMDGGSTEEELNDVLADAILKRPESIRRQNKRGDSQRAVEKEVESGQDPWALGDEQQTEFTFPSLSDLGNVSANRSQRVQTSRADDVTVNVAENGAALVGEDPGLLVAETGGEVEGASPLSQVESIDVRSGGAERTATGLDWSTPSVGHETVDVEHATDTGSGVESPVENHFETVAGMEKAAGLLNPFDFPGSDTAHSHPAQSAAPASDSDPEDVTPKLEGGVPALSTVNDE
ncbi:hypothetical protein HGRIS_014139 [Hohenbuehelia grisea]|uniref:Uncharacterized protein n=1 Tax=Hohenbuehelia grisea TaxID=104357 RepID=A0ABR3JSI6_9AGAR